jgi:hypothetical protein
MRGSGERGDGQQEHRQRVGRAAENAGFGAAGMEQS